MENEKIVSLVERMVCRLVRERFLSEDLLQEARIHLWQIEQQRGDETQSWYVQSCHQVVHDFLRQGRSVDSLKRRAAQMPDVQWDDPQNETLLDSILLEGSLEGQVSAADIIAVLKKRLSRRESQVLGCLAIGLSTRETARELNLSHTTVAKSRQAIASMALTIGIRPLSQI